MKQILLAPEEMVEVAKEAFNANAGLVKVLFSTMAFDAVAKAQLKKVRGKIAVAEIPEGKAAGYNVEGKLYIALAMLKEDWEGLLKEIEEE